MQIEGWYGAQPRAVEVCTATALWYYSGTVMPSRWVLLRDPEQRFDPQALLCTDLSQTPRQIVQWFVQRWQVEVTFAEVRMHLGVETQRQWGDLAIARTTPCLLALFSIVTLLGDRLLRGGQLPVRSEAWYRKKQATFSDTLAGGAPPSMAMRFPKIVRKEQDGEIIEQCDPLLTGSDLPRCVMAKVKLTATLLQQSPKFPPLLASLVVQPSPEQRKQENRL